MVENMQSTGSKERERGPVAFPPPVIYIGGLLIGVLLEVLFPTPNLPAWLAVTAGVLGAAASVSLDFRAMTLFRRKSTPLAPWLPTAALVTEGPYRISRNPMYLGMALLYVALSLAFGLMWSIALSPVVILVIDRAVIRREEVYLTERYGEEYRQYRTQVRRWI